MSTSVQAENSPGSNAAIQWVAMEGDQDEMKLVPATA